MRTLKSIIKDAGLSQAAIARKINISEGAFSILLNHGMWPRKNPKAVREALTSHLEERGLDREEINAALDAPCASTASHSREGGNPGNQINSPSNEPEVIMIRKQVLTPTARRKFGAMRDIFTDELNDPDDVFFSKETRYVRECLYHLARHGGMMALIGESGSGKSTLRRDLITRLEREDSRIVVIEPYVLGMDTDAKKSVGMRAQHICEAILTAIAPGFKKNSTPEAMFRQMHAALRDSFRAGFRHLLIIEEAHSLSAVTVKHLKRFLELEDGLSRLLSILLIGQPELKTKLAETNAEVREVVQRTELLELYPMDDLEGYVRHRCGRAGAKFEEIFAPDALATLAMRLTGPRAKGRNSGASMLYPLLVGNMLTRAINLAVDLKQERVTADTIMSA